MKIVLITGQSGSGKTTIAKKLCEDNKYNYINSYTDRELRERNEWGHNFVDANYMDLILESADVIAQTTIDSNRYCTIRSQFDENKINVYIVDLYGINDVFTAFPQADIMTVLISRSETEVDCVRMNRDVCVPAREDVHFTINNNGTVESTAGTLNTLVNFDLFCKPSHTIQTINNKIHYLEEQERHMRTIKESLQSQLWYNNYPMYIKTIEYVTKKVNEEFDFEITITPDTEPAIYDGELHFHIIGEYDNEENDWATINSLVSRMSHHAHTFCQEHNCSDILYHMIITEKWQGEDDYL